MSGARLKVVSISHTAHGLGSGRLRYEALAETGAVELVVVVPDRWRDSGVNKPADPNVSPVDIRFRQVRLPYARAVKWYAHWYPGLGALLREISPDVLHLWEEPWGMVALQACILRNRYAPQAALVLETEQNILHKLPFPFECTRRFTLRQTDWLIARSREAAGVSTAVGYRGGSTLVEYCVDKSFFHPQDLSIGGRNASVNVSPARSLKVGYVGRLIKEKGLFTVLEALKVCTPEVTLTLVGDGCARKELADQVDSSGLQQRVKFMKPQSPEKVASFMHSCDVLLLMSETTATWKEQFGRVIIEAQACGTPVIGSSSGAIPSVIGEGGWIVPEGDPDALAILLDRLATNPQLIADAKIAALRNIKRFDREKVAQDFLSALRHAANLRHTRHYQRLNTVDELDEKNQGILLKQATNRSTDLVPDLRASGDDGLIANLPAVGIGTRGLVGTDSGGGGFSRGERA
jgi:glycosyltransferase involved in cell wall biosynthesis